MTFPKPKEVTRRRAEYVGKRIELISMAGDPDPVPAGTRGTCTMVDDAGQLMMNWDNGRGLSLIPGVDRFQVVDHQEGKCPECGSTNVQYRKKTDDFSCRACGADFVPTM